MKYKYFVCLCITGWLIITGVPVHAQLVNMNTSMVTSLKLDFLDFSGDNTQISLEKTNFVVRDIFQLKYGHYRDAIALIDEAMKSKLLPTISTRVMTDFTGDAYRLILESGYNSLNDYEKSLSSELNADLWKTWYDQFKTHVESSSREILRWVR